MFWSWPTQSTTSAYTQKIPLSLCACVQTCWWQRCAAMQTLCQKCHRHFWSFSPSNLKNLKTRMKIQITKIGVKFEISFLLFWNSRVWMEFFHLAWRTSHMEFFVCTNESGQKMLLNAIRYFISRPISKIEFNIIKSTKQKVNSMEEERTKGSARQRSNRSHSKGEI